VLASITAVQPYDGELASKETTMTTKCQGLTLAALFTFLSLAFAVNAVAWPSAPAMQVTVLMVFCAFVAAVAAIVSQES
jgi:hypothetical protein